MENNMVKLPEDPAILLSFINTMLRDKYKNLSELCDDFNINDNKITEKLDLIGYKYSPEQNQFK
jgi:predicted SnoaL-like aldol condensation-catalyzing enzyme